MDIIFKSYHDQNLNELIWIADKWISLPVLPPKLKKLIYQCFSDELGTDRLIKVGMLPHKLEYLEMIFQGSRDLFVEPNALPNGLKSLKIKGSKLKGAEPLTENYCPSSLEHVSLFGTINMQVFLKYIPGALKSLKLNYFCDLPDYSCV